MELVAEGLTTEGLADADALFGEKDRGAVRLYLKVSQSQSELVNFQTGLLNRGVVLTENVRGDARIVAVNFEVGVAPLAIVAEEAKKRFEVLGWQLWKEANSLWPWVAGGVALGLLLAQGKGR